MEKCFTEYEVMVVLEPGRRSGVGVLGAVQTGLRTPCRVLVLNHFVSKVPSVE